MPEFSIALNTARGLALARATEAMLHTVGGGEVIFRLPAFIAIAGDSTRQELALDAKASQDFAVSPVLVRYGSKAFELLVSPKSLEMHLQSTGITAEQFLKSTIAIVAHDRLLRIESFAPEVFAGTVYLYRISATE
jgi:hypothetical protein